MTYTVTCGENAFNQPDPVTVEVTGDHVEVISETVPMQVATVDRFLDIIANAEAHGADRVDVDYGEYGQPLRIDLDPMEGAIDDEFCAHVTMFGIPRR